MNLVIVESPAKAKTIQKYLGKGNKVTASKGHIVDLPKSGLAVDVDNDFAPEYVITKKEVLTALKKDLKSADKLILAVDPDREGEAIGWHIARELKLIDSSGKSKKGALPVERIVFTEITAEAVQAAAAQPRKLDMDLVNAQQARRILDRLVGYKLSPLLWKKIRYGLSAGRVQSVAVRLIVDRELEREKFNAEEYWEMDADLLLEKSKNKPKTVLLEKQDETTLKVDAKGLLFSLVKIDGKKPSLVDGKKVLRLQEKLVSSAWKIEDITESEVTKNPSPPFTTSTLQQAAVNKLGMSSKTVMQAAQKLYEAGLITYMRTDSVAISAQAVNAVRTYLSATYGDKYIPEKPNFYANRSKSAQEAHEAIRPTQFDKTASQNGLTGQHAKVYDLIRHRELASQMSKARVSLQTVQVAAENCIFQIIGRKVLFPGYLKIYKDQVSEVDLPALEIGQELFLHQLVGSQHFTQPPARYTEASLVKELEKLGIGRPSTYAPIIQTIQARKYVEKENRYFFPTDTGRVVTSLLKEHFQDIVDVNFTAGMEEDLDMVAEGKKEWIKMLSSFYKPFARLIAAKDKQIMKEDFTVLEISDEKCPKCSKKMVVKLGRYGKFLSCSDFPACDGMLAFAEEERIDPAEKVKSKEFKETYNEAPKTDDGLDYVLKRGRFGEFWAHPDYPKVKDTKPLELRPEKLEEAYGKPPKTDDGRAYLIKRGRFGPFWAHPDYPEVKDIQKVAKRKK